MVNAYGCVLVKARITIVSQLAHCFALGLMMGIKGAHDCRVYD